MEEMIKMKVSDVNFKWEKWLVKAAALHCVHQRGFPRQSSHHILANKVTNGPKLSKEVEAVLETFTHSKFMIMENKPKSFI